MANGQSCILEREQVIQMNDLTQMLISAMQEYTEEATDDFEKKIDKIGQSGLKVIKSMSPSRTGMYRKGWRKKFLHDDGTVRIRLYNKTEWQLTHLLESSHKTGIHGSYTKPHPHVAPVQELVDEEVIEAAKEAFGRK